MKSIKFVIFDMDGLMFDTEGENLKSHIKSFARHGCKFNATAYASGVGTSRRPDYEKINEGNNISTEEAREILEKSRVDTVERMLRLGVPIKSGLFELLDELDALNIKKCVATSTAIEMSGRILKKAGVFDRFDFIVTGAEVKNGKPAPDIFLKACEIAGVKQENALVLEDSVGGCTAAYNAHIPYICIPNLHDPDEDTRKHAVFVGESLNEVITYLKEG